MKNKKITSAMGKSEDLSKLIEKMIRNPDGEAVYFGSLREPLTTMDREDGIRKYV